MNNIRTSFSSSFYNNNTRIIHNHNNTIDAKYQLSLWLQSQSFSHYMTIDLPFNLKHITNYDSAIRILHTIVKRFNKSLQGRSWYKHPVQFIGFTELGKSMIYHWHLLLKGQKYTDEQMYYALDTTENFCKLQPHTIHIEPIVRTPEILNNYSIKEFKVDKHNHMNTDKIITSEILFNKDF